MKQIEMLIPQYIKEFRCIGSECEDSCCMGWKITIDEHTYKKYKKLSHQKMRKKLDKYVGRNRIAKTKYEIAKIRLEDGKCPFLRQDKLCEIQRELGESYLSNTCAIYPRLNNKVGTGVEQGLTLSCPEAARLVLLNQQPMQFDQDCREFTERNLEIKEVKINSRPLIWKDYFWEIRIFTIGLLQNRHYKLEERLLILGLVYKNLEKLIKEKQINGVQECLEKYQSNIDNYLYKDILGDIPTIIEMQIKLCKELVDIRYAKGIHSATYKTCLSEVLLGLKFEDEMSLEDNTIAYQEGYNRYYKDFIQEHAYILENYLVNYVFTKGVPVDRDSIFESYVQLILHYAIVKLHWIGRSNYHKGLTEEVAVQTIQILTKTFEHDLYYFKNILTLIEDNHYMDLAHMAILIKN